MFEIVFRIIVVSLLAVLIEQSQGCISCFIEGPVMVFH